MAGLVDPPRLINSAMVHPDNDILLVPTSRTDRYRQAMLVDGDQRAGGVEPDPADGQLASGLGDGFADGRADGLPDIIR